MSEINPQAVDLEPIGGISLDDAAVETPNNLQTEPSSEGQALSDILEQSAQEPEPEPEASRPPNKEPGWVKRRIDDALGKKLPELVAVEAAKIRAEYEMQIKPLREAQLARDADDLIRQGEFKTREIALEYLRMKQGLPVQPPAVRNEPNREVPASNNVEARAAELMAQARYAQKVDGIDPLEIYRTDKNVAELVNSGEWDFADVVKAAKQGQPPPSPSPIYSSNAAIPSKRGPHELSKDEWQRLNDNLAKGVKVDMRR